MIPREFEYSAPATLQDALNLLAEEGAKPLAGGMSLIPLMKLRLAVPRHVVDLNRVPDLNRITENAGSLHIGALVTHYEVESSALIRSRCPLLAETAANIGDVQVRNMGTIGGSVVHADPAADYPGALFALEAKVRVVGRGSERTLPIDDFTVDALITSLEPGEIVTEIIVPVEEPGTGVNYQKMKQPASGFAIVGVGARVRKNNGKVSMVRVGVTGLGPKGFRATKAEEQLAGTAGTGDDVRKAAGAVADGVEANSDLHASAEYRKHMAVVYAARALRISLGRAS